LKPLRAAVVGCGWIGSEVADDPLADGIQSHAAAYAQCADTELVGVCDRDAARADRAARRWGLGRGTTGIAELLETARPEIVSVCTPDATHAEVIREVLASPGVRAIVAEKPLALSLGEARDLVALAKRCGVVLAVNYVRRFSASHVEVRRRIAGGEIGIPVAVAGLYTKGVLHNGTHWFDLAHWLVGRIVRVQAWPGATDAARPDPTCHTRVVFEGGQSGFLAGLDETLFTAFELDIIGTAGRVRVTDSGMRVRWSAVAPSPHYTGYRTLQTTAELPGSFKDVALRMIENLVAALRNGAGLLCTGEDALAALAVAEAARASLRTGAEMQVSEADLEMSR